MTPVGVLRAGDGRPRSGHGVRGAGDGERRAVAGDGERRAGDGERRAGDGDGERRVGQQAPLRVLVVDDEAPARARLRVLLGDCTEPAAQVVGEAADAAQALAWLAGAACDVVLLDIALPARSGLQLAADLQAQRSAADLQVQRSAADLQTQRGAAARAGTTPRAADRPGAVVGPTSLDRAPAIVFVTAHADHALRAFELDAADYLTKPVRLERLQAALRRVAQRRRPLPPAEVMAVAGAVGRVQGVSIGAGVTGARSGAGLTEAGSGAGLTEAGSAAGLTGAGSGVGLTEASSAADQAGLQRVAGRPNDFGESIVGGALDDAGVIVVHDRGQLLRVPVAAVLYLKAELKYLTLRTATHSHVLDGTLGEYEHRLGTAFLRIHRNALVARRAVRALARQSPAPCGAGSSADATRAASDRTHGPDQVKGEVTGDHAEPADGWFVVIAGVHDALPVSRRQLAAVRAALA